MVEAEQDAADRSAVVNKSKRYAVVVGINDYKEAGIGNLAFCAADAETFYDALLTYCEYDPGCITLFSDGEHPDAQKPRRSSILEAINSMANHATENDSILFFFAGHGTHDDRDSYLLTQEYRSSVVAETSIPMEVINDYLRKSKARFTMRFFDACHSGRLGTRTAPVGPDVRKHFLVEGEGFATLSACKEEQFAHEDPGLGHGIFSYCLVKGLSGEAATPEGEITLQSLSTYTIAKTGDITSQLGLPQTPVFVSGFAGTLVMATLDKPRPDNIPTALVKVQETAIEQIRPTPEKIPKFVEDIRTILQNRPAQVNYIASYQDEKVVIGDMLVRKVLHWCQEQERTYHDQLKDLVSISVKHQPIRDCPLTFPLAKYILDSKIKEAVEWELTYRTEQVKSKLFGASILDYGTRQVLDGVRERPRYYESAVQLSIYTKETLMPECAMVIAIVPATFGLYLLRYSCSTKLSPGQVERWDQSTFTIRTLHAIPFTDRDGTQTLEELQDLYPQFVSFFAESCAARRRYLENIGASGQSLL